MVLLCQTKWHLYLNKFKFCHKTHCLQNPKLVNNVVGMFTVIIRELIIYILILVVFRLMGKRQIGQMQPFEFVLTLIIADLAVIPMSEIALPLVNGIVPLLTLVIFHFLITTLTRKSNSFSRLISGKPVIIVNPNGIDYKALKSLNITIDDLYEAIRGEGFFNFDEINYAIMETNGKVSIMPKSENSPATAKDLNIKKEENSLPLTIIIEGKFMEENLKISTHNKDFYLNFLKKHKILSIKDVLLLTIDSSGKIFLQQKNQKFKVYGAN